MSPPDSSTVDTIRDAVEWALAHGVAFRASPFSTMHTPFALTPTPITKDRFQNLKAKAGLLGKVVHAASEDEAFLKEAIEPIMDGDPFFKQMWSMNQQLEEKGKHRTPLLIMRSDFMDDAEIGPRVIEFNGIAAGMQPFGQRIHELHSYLMSHAPEVSKKYASSDSDTLVENEGIERLADGINKATRQIKEHFKDEGPPRFLMVVQENEDNVYDQHLLEYALNDRGVQTVRKSFKQLHAGLKTGDDKRLLFDGIGPIDTVYLRAGYLHCDYYSKELDGDEQGKCCVSLMTTRIFMEQHRVAMNATVNQQLASSKRVQTLLSAMSAEELQKFGVTLEEAQSVKELLGENKPVTTESIEWMQKQDAEQWVLKNQGEGGGHAVMGGDIVPKLQQLKPEDYPAWCLMRRLRPAPRTKPTILVRKGEATDCEDLISEIGVFTVHINGLPATAPEEEGYAGYLIRSKPAKVSEGGVHSGLGVLDSLVFNEKSSNKRQRTE